MTISRNRFGPTNSEQETTDRTSAGHNPALRNAPAHSVESHDPGPATLLFLSGDRQSVHHSPDSQDPPIKILHRSLEVEKTPPTNVLQLSLGSASEELSLKPNDQTSKPPDELLETAPESPGIPLITTPESYSLNSISSWPHRFRVVATILARRSRNRSKPHSTRSCVWHAEIAVCQHIQQSRFAPQLDQTQAGKPLSKSWSVTFRCLVGARAVLDTLILDPLNLDPLRPSRNLFSSASSWTHAYPSRIQRRLDLTTHFCSHSTTLRGSPLVTCDWCNLIPNSLQTPLIPRQVTALIPSPNAVLSDGIHRKLWPSHVQPVASLTFTIWTGETGTDAYAVALP
ncbi:hypothetical protein AAG570_002732 [Ranatra chinensis]|uniref:Uncharacterized protein n=1 Tax=Ranatra chinensis TaxID=642074 RepID=A0ABD0Y8I0_9HEMI